MFIVEWILDTVLYWLIKLNWLEGILKREAAEQKKLKLGGRLELVVLVVICVCSMARDTNPGTWEAK
jgi:hypothetical protein